MGWGSWLGSTSVPVLCYHNLGGNGVPREAFAAQMRWLADNGVKTLSLAEFEAFLDGRPLTGPSALVTFDDGFRDLSTFAGPVLRERGQRATVFVINDRMRDDDAPGQDGEITAHKAHRDFMRSGERAPWLSWQELKVLVEENILDVGSHSLSHVMLPAAVPELVELPDHWTYESLRGENGPFSRRRPELAGPLWLEAEKRLETAAEMRARVRGNLLASRLGLEERLGRPVRALAWPWGETCPEAESAADEAGLPLRFTLARGAVTRATPKGAVPRLEVRRNKPLSWFISRMMLYSRAWTATLYSGTRI